MGKDDYLCSVIVVRPIMRKVLVLLVLMLAGGLHLSLSAEPCRTQPTAFSTVGQTHEETPAWQDLGLEDLLACTGQSVLPAAQTPHSGGSVSAHQEPSAPRLRIQNRRLPLLPRANDYYLFFLYRLRL